MCSFIVVFAGNCIFFGLSSRCFVFKEKVGYFGLKLAQKDVNARENGGNCNGL